VLPDNHPDLVSLMHNISWKYNRVNDEYQCTHLPEDRVQVECRVKKVDLAREIPDLKVDERTVLSTLSFVGKGILYVILHDFGC
jgi:hypothetical protein